MVGKHSTIAFSLANSLTIVRPKHSLLTFIFDCPETERNNYKTAKKKEGNEQDENT